MWALGKSTFWTEMHFIRNQIFVKLLQIKQIKFDIEHKQMLLYLYGIYMETQILQKFKTKSDAPYRL